MVAPTSGLVVGLETRPVRQRVRRRARLCRKGSAARPHFTPSNMA
jgi:hypothetical protein